MDWKDYVFIFAMSGLVLVARIYGVNGEFIAFVAGALGVGGVMIGRGRRNAPRS